MQEEEWKDFSEYRAITHRLINTNKLHFRVLGKNLEGLGIHRASHRVLMTLACHQFASQAELAKRINSTKSYISKVENGIIVPSVGAFYRIINALGMRVEVVKTIY